MRVCQFRHFGTGASAGQSPVRHLQLPQSVKADAICQPGPRVRCLRNGSSNLRRYARIRKATEHGRGGADVPPIERTMSQPHIKLPGTVAPSNDSTIPEDLALEIRKLAHDLSNSLEIIVQTSYLLSTADLKSPASDWLHMLDNGVTKAMDINMALRNYIKAHSPR